MKNIPPMNKPRLPCITAMTSLLQPIPTHDYGRRGMWLFNNPPRNQRENGFDIADSRLEHVQKSSVHFNSGGSGSSVSEDGLVMSITT
jgi:hypothetical protein